MPSPSWMCLGSWVVRLRSIFWSKRKQEEEKKKKKKRKRKEKKGNVPWRRWRGDAATRSFHGVRKDAATLSFPCSERIDDECTRNALVSKGYTYVYKYTDTSSIQAEIARTRPTERTGSTGIEAPSKPSQSPRLDLSRESRERVHERTHTQAGTRAESRSQSPAVGGRFDVAAAAATFATLNTFISRSAGSLSFFRIVLPHSLVPLSLSLLLCSCTTLSTSFRNSSRCPRGLNFTPCRDNRVWRCSSLPCDTINSSLSFFPSPRKSRFVDF